MSICLYTLISVTRKQCKPLLIVTNSCLLRHRNRYQNARNVISRLPDAFETRLCSETARTFLSERASKTSIC